MDQKKNITVTLESKEIRFDIMTRSHLAGKVRGAEGKDYRVASYMQVAQDDESDYPILRFIGKAFSWLKSELNEYLHEEGSTSNNRIDKIIENGEQLKLQFIMPSNFDNTTCDSLGDLLHEYIVDRTLSEWFVITDKEEVKDYAALAADALDSVRRALHKRERPKRPTHNDD